MKIYKFAAIALALSALTYITACGNTASQNQNNQTEVAATEAVSSPLPLDITDKITEEIEFPSPVKKGLPDVSDYYYDIDVNELTDASFILCGSGAYPDELAVFKFDTKENAEKAEITLKNRLDEKISTFETYAPDEMYKLNSAIITVKSEYIIFCAVSDNEKAQSIINSFYDF